MEPEHLLHTALTSTPNADARGLKPKHPFVPAAQFISLSDTNNNIRAAHWADHQRNAEWADNPTRLLSTNQQDSAITARPLYWIIYIQIYVMKKK